MKKILSTIFILAFITVILTGCQDRTDLTAPSPKSGTVDLSSFVSIGNSITAGYQSNALFQDGQIWSYGNQIAKVANTNYAIPFISNPGLGGDFVTAQIQIHSLSPLLLIQQPSSGMPLNSAYATPYNNLGIPGAMLKDVLNTSSSATNPFFNIILRGKGTQFQQTKALNPTFVTCWIGNNDVLGYATDGGVSMRINPGVATPYEPTSATDFNTQYVTLGDSLASLGAKVVVANIPDVTTIPYFTTVGPMVAPKVPWGQLPLLGSPGFCYQKHGKTFPDPTSATDSIHLASLQVLLTLAGQEYASLIGTPTGLWYRRNHYTSLPLGIDTTKAFGFDPRNPWPDALILDADEIVSARTATDAYNASILNVATNKGFGFVNIHDVFINIFLQSLPPNTGVKYDGINFTAFFITGGLFSLDGVHPSSQGHGLIANEFLKVINSKFGASYPLINLATIPGNVILGKKVITGNFISEVKNWNMYGY